MNEADAKRLAEIDSWLKDFSDEKLFMVFLRRLLCESEAEVAKWQQEARFAIEGSKALIESACARADKAEAEIARLNAPPITGVLDLAEQLVYGALGATHPHQIDLIQPIAAALAAAKRAAYARAIEDAAQIAEPKHKPRMGEHGRIAEAVSQNAFETRKQLAARIRALVAPTERKEPT